MPMYGAIQFKGRKWAPGLRVSGIIAPAEEYRVNPALLPLGFDPRYPTGDQVVIPRGRLISVMKFNGYSPAGVNDSTGLGYSQDKAFLTLADGVDIKNKPTVGYSGGNNPGGFTESNIFRKWEEHPQDYPVLDKQAYIEVPYVPSINNAYGVLTSGDKITPYYGSANSVTQNPGDVGKIVRWVERKLFSVSGSGATTIVFPAAVYVAFPPQIVSARNGLAAFATALPSVYTGSITFNGTTWQATFSTAVTDVLYTFGQGVDQIAGEVGKVEPLNATHQFDGWLQWVTDNFSVWDYAPALMRVPTTPITSEPPAYLGANAYQMVNRPISPSLPITVVLAPTTGNSFTVTDEVGNVTTVTSSYTNSIGANGGVGYVLPDAGQTSVGTPFPFGDYTLGKHYNINPVTGQFYLSPAVQYTGSAVDNGASQIKISYSYETGYRNGRLWSPGIIGLTDGANTGYPGTPANLDVINGAGSLRAIIY